MHARTSEPRILIIDDDADMRDCLSAILEMAGYAVLAAADGLEGLKQVAICTPDLITLDLEMPRMNGREFLQAMEAKRFEQSPPPVVVISGKHRDSAGLDGISIAGYLQKPVAAEDLLELIAGSVTIQRAPRPGIFAGLRCPCPK